MKKYLIKIACILGILFLGVGNVMNVANAGTNKPGDNNFAVGDNNKIKKALQGDDQTADKTIQDLIARISLFLALIAVVLALYGGFLILTAGLKEENVKKGRTIIVYALIGLVVIFLAYSIVSWVITSVLGMGNQGVAGDGTTTNTFILN